MPPTEAGRSRILFLDDDRERARCFLTEYPDAVWVETADQCVARLAEPWDEIHLDHDLSGEVLVDHERPDCGMEVVRWLCEEPRPHLQSTRFIVHTQNPNAAVVMMMHLQVTGYRVEERPFGFRLPDSGRGSGPRPGPFARLLDHLRRYLSGRR